MDCSDNWNSVLQSTGPNEQPDLITDTSTLKFIDLCINKDLTCAKVSFDVCLEKKMDLNIRCLGDPYCYYKANELYLEDLFSFMDDKEDNPIA